jgi:SOS response regulatory protein OraA/RecX
MKTVLTHPAGASLRSHREVARVLHRAGYSEEIVSEVLTQLLDPVDLQRDQQILARYGLSPERLMDRLGGSP